MIRTICALAAAAALPFLATSHHAASADSRQATRESTPRPVLHVGAGRKLTRPSAAAQVARDGDIVEIDAGVYEGDAAIWTQHGLTIRGVGGRAHLRANGAHAENKAIWVIKGSNTTVENVEFSGAAVPHRNGAGIRQEGAGLTVRNCYFHHNENGILTGANPESDIVIEHSEFAYNGHGDGYSHNLYIGTVRSFTLRFSYVHRAVVGHNVKSRALRNLVAYNRITDENDGRSSYSIDFPNGGISFVLGNVIQQGPAAENDALVAFGLEGLNNPLNALYFVNNTLVNDLSAGGRFLFVKGETATVWIVNNLFSGPGQMLSGPGEMHNNLLADRSDFVDAAAFDYRLKDGVPAIGRAINPGQAAGFDLRLTDEYVHKSKKRARKAPDIRDLGAIEHRPQQ
jgi:Right handed beta helix region